MRIARRTGGTNRRKQPGEAGAQNVSWEWGGGSESGGNGNSEECPPGTRRGATRHQCNSRVGVCRKAGQSRETGRHGTERVSHP